MAKSFLPEDLYQYTLQNWHRDDEILAELREVTAQMPNGGMQIGPDQGQFMTLLAKAIGAKKILEVGTFTGYSALCLARALPDGGELVACDVSDEFTSVGKPFWERAGLTDKIKLHLGPALDTLDREIAAGGIGTFDLAFIDADKTNYMHYVDRALVLLRVGGLLLIDNVLWNGELLDPKKDDPDTEAIRALNAALAVDERLDLALLPIADGLTVALKR
jgi:caffeoyl-CoA O-methyltransferase